MPEIRFAPLPGFPEIEPGADRVAAILETLTGRASARKRATSSRADTVLGRESSAPPAKSRHQIVFRAGRGQREHRHLGEAPHLTQYFEAMDPRQHHI